MSSPTEKERARGRAVAGILRGLGERFFAGSVVDERLNSALRESLGHQAIAVGGPLLGSPSGARVKDHKVVQAEIAQALLYRLARRLGSHGRTASGMDCRSPIMDSAISAYCSTTCVRPRDDSPAVPQARQILARLSGSINSRCARPARKNGRARSSLQVDRNLVSSAAQIAQPCRDALPRFRLTVEIAATSSVSRRGRHRPAAAPETARPHAALTARTATPPSVLRSAIR